MDTPALAFSVRQSEDRIDAGATILFPLRTDAPTAAAWLGEMWGNVLATDLLTS